MEATVVSVGRSVLNGALGFAKSTLAEEVALQLGVQRDQAFIRDELEMMQSFLEAAHDERDDSNKVVRTWVKQVRDVAYDVEDCLQDFAVRLGKKKPSWWLSPGTLRERRRIAKQMKELRGKVEDVSQRNLRYQLVKGSKPTAADFMPNSTARVTMSGTNEAWQQEEKAKADLVHLVNSKVEDLRVIAVWGTSGDRKEISITERAYSHFKIKSKFECYAWIDVTHPLKTTKLMQNIVRQFYVRSLEDTREVTPACQVLMRTSMVNEDDLADEFNRYLSDKCYLIVITDLSNTEGWEQIKMCFPDNKKGSRIIVSTQQVEVAILCAGTEEAAPKHTQLFADRTLYAFHYEGGEDGTYLMESTSSLNAAISCSSNSAEGKSLTATETMVAAFRESDFIGRVHEKEEIIELILKDSEQHKIISVWGMGGMGKTTLIRDVYRSKKVQGMFDKLACDTIKRSFNPSDLITSLVDQLKDQKEYERKGTPKISGKKEPSLADILYGKKYLIVLDDVLSTKEWDAIVSNFPDMGIGSRIIVTTRHESIAMHCSGNQEEKCYHLHNLGEKDAEELFTKKVFKQPKNLDVLDPELVEEAKLILKKCSGLPLAIVTIGGFLTSRPKTALEWRKLKEHISAELETNPELGGIRTVLNISYDSLSYHLKSCFLYLSIFPEDHEINRKRLARRWTAEGYSRGIWDKSPKEISDNYFFELLDRSMILPTQKSNYSGKGTQFCQLHDIIRDIAISKSKEENLVLRLDGGRISHDHGTVHHLAITNGSWEMDENELETAIDMSRLRSLTVFGVWRPFFISDKMRLLRVLDLEDTEGVRGHQIKKIGKLVHLRYLSLRGCREIAFLPDSFGKLSQLETLDVRGTSIIKLPKAIINLRKLNYLRTGDTIIGATYDLIEDGMIEPMTKSLLSCIDMPLDDYGVQAPRGLRRLTALHTLGVVNIAWDPSVLEDIKRLTHLRKLGVTSVNKQISQKFYSTLAALSRLESLSVRSQKKQDLSSCLFRDVFSPPKDLKSLKLHGNLVELPKWIQQLKNLVKLKLVDTRLKNHGGAIKVLGELPNLAILNLWHNSLGGEEFHFLEGSFGSLVVLVLSFRDIKNVNFERGAFKKLESIVLYARWYDHVETMFSGLEFLPSIKEVQLQGYSTNKEGTEKLKEHLQAELSVNQKKPILKNDLRIL